MKALLADNQNKTPKMVLSDYPEPTPRPGELLVQIHATALNRADLLQKQGKYPPPEGASPLLGLEMAGEVLETGEGVRSFQPGDRVFGLLPGGGYAQRCTLPASIALPLPESFTFTEGAAIAEAFITSWQSLVWLGGLNRNETVLIHGGASGVGSAAIQIASRLYECRVLTTAGSEEKRSFCRGLGADLAVDYQTTDFAEVLIGEIGEKEVQLVLDIAGASHWNRNLRLLGMDGRLVLLSLLGGAKVEKMNLVPILAKRLAIRGTTLRNRSDLYKAELVQDFYTHCKDALASGTLHPVIDSEYNWREVEQAHKRMEENRNIGKILLTGMADEPV
ncbi:MAG: NAD(P)H-quinone oxidoreductase [Balneolaceae bacterium]